MITLRREDGPSRPVDWRLLDACNDAAAKLRQHRRHGAYSLSYARVEIRRTVLCLHKNCPDGWPKEWGTARHDLTAGEVEVLVCNTCLYATTNCTHEKSTWRGPVDGPELPGDISGGPFLICDTCGTDGT